MSIQEFEEGETMECPYCEKEFTDFDEYFEHYTTCDREENQWELENGKPNLKTK